MRPVVTETERSLSVVVPQSWPPSRIGQHLRDLADQASSAQAARLRAVAELFLARMGVPGCDDPVFIVELAGVGHVKWTALHPAPVAAV